MLLFILLAMATDGRLNTEAPAVPPPAANITLTLVNTFPAYGEGSSSRALGLAVHDDGMIAGVNNIDGRAYYYLPETGAVVGYATLHPANTKCFGLAIHQWGPAEWTYLTNDWSLSNFFYTEDYGLTWTWITDPSGESGRGMDYDGTHYWSTLGTGSLIRLALGGSHIVYPVPETSGQLSGLAVFPHEGATAVAVTSYVAQGIWFYQFTGLSLQYMGYGQLPFSYAVNLYGLAYSAQSDCLHLSFSTATGYYICQLEFEIAQSLTPATWASIKAAL